MIELSVNLNKIALLRNSRGGEKPSIVEAAEIAINAGAYGITLHPRPDMRHVRPHDVMDLAKLLRTRHPGIELNIEGNPFAAAAANGYPGFDALIDAARPNQCTLVPDSDAQLTSDHGWDAEPDPHDDCAGGARVRTPRRRLQGGHVLADRACRDFASTCSRERMLVRPPWCGTP